MLATTTNTPPFWPSPPKHKLLNTTTMLDEIIIFTAMAI